MPEWLQIVLTALGTATVLVLTASASGVKRLIDAWFTRREAAIKLAELRAAETEAEDRERRRRNKYADGFTGMVTYQRIHAQLKAIPAVQRLLVFEGRNGGGIPTPGEKYTVTAVDGWSMIEGKQPMNTYTPAFMVDDYYVNMLAEMVRKGKVVNATADMPEGAVLRAYYTIEGVAYSIVYFIRIDPKSNRLDFISVGSYSGPFSALDIAQIERCVYQMRTLANQQDQ